MNSTDKINKDTILSRINLFENISEKSKKFLSEICLTKHVKKKQHLFFEGEKGMAVYILITGSIQLYKTAPDGKEVVIKVVKPEEIFAEVVLYQQDHYPVNAVALKNSYLFMIPKHQFICLLKNEDFSRDFFGNLIEKLRYLTERIKYLTLHDVEERLYIFLKEHHGRKDKIVSPLSKKDIASSIGATPETLSRLILRLKKENKIIWKKNVISLSDAFWKTYE